MEVPESLFARLEDDIIVHIASALPLNDASNFMLTCKRTHTLATTRVDTWWNRSLLTSRSLWCAIGVVKALVETPDGSDFDIDAYDRLIQDLEPHEAIRDESIGLNLKFNMLKSDVCLATISGLPPPGAPILVMSHTTMSSLLWLSLPTLARYFPS